VTYVPRPLTSTNHCQLQVKQKAKQLADTILGPGHDFKASSGWYDNWKKRKNIFDLTLDPPADVCQ
jgi:hypothetical protein